ncbi:MAG: hypothetical protein H6Q35_406 [Proteobacteria bacterium]|nr:hypothetical protein [Pseudomonadota bacterium]
MKTTFSQKRSFLKVIKQSKVNPYSMMVSRSALMAHIACIPPLDDVTYTAVSNEEPSFNEVNMLASLLVSSVISTFLEKKLQDDPNALFRLIEHFEELNSNDKKK